MVILEYHCECPRTVVIYLSSPAPCLHYHTSIELSLLLQEKTLFFDLLSLFPIISFSLPLPCSVFRDSTLFSRHQFHSVEFDPKTTLVHQYLEYPRQLLEAQPSEPFLGLAFLLPHELGFFTCTLETSHCWEAPSTEGCSPGYSSLSQTCFWPWPAALSPVIFDGGFPIADERCPHWETPGMHWWKLNLRRKRSSPDIFSAVRKGSYFPWSICD